MGLRFHRSIQLLPGVRVNLSKGGVSLSLGGSPVTFNIGRRGERVTTSLPGTGLSYSESSSEAASLFGRLKAWLARLFA